MIPKHIADLIAVKKIHVLTSEQEQVLDLWRKESERNEEAYQYTCNRTQWKEDLELMNEIDTEAALEKTWAVIHRLSPRPFWKRWQYVGVAASILLAIMLVLVKEYHKDNNDILPGSNKAVLWLADGSRIPLREDQKELIISDDLIYGDGSSLRKIDSKETLRDFLEISTPKGGGYTIVLSDKSKVILNAASTLRFPKRFLNGDRHVELDGEAYFDVSRQSNSYHKQTAFVVKTTEQTVRVLGTQFNISAYSDQEDTYTTLVEGKVVVEAVHGAKQARELLPGQQLVHRNGKPMDVRSVDVFNYISWIQNQFVFTSTSLENVMKQVARWYNIDYRFEKEEFKNEQIEGVIPRYTAVKDLLDLLQKSGNFKFRIVNRVVYIY